VYGCFRCPRQHVYPNANPIDLCNQHVIILDFISASIWTHTRTLFGTYYLCRPETDLSMKVSEENLPIGRSDDTFIKQPVTGLLSVVGNSRPATGLDSETAGITNIRESFQHQILVWAKPINFRTQDEILHLNIGYLFSHSSRQGCVLCS